MISLEGGVAIEFVRRLHASLPKVTDLLLQWAQLQEQGIVCEAHTHLLRASLAPLSNLMLNVCIQLNIMKMCNQKKI